MSRTDNRTARPVPLILDVAESILVGQAVARGESLAFFYRTGDDHRTDGSVVNVRYRCSCGCCRAFDTVLKIGVARCCDGDRFTDIRLNQRVAVTGPNHIRFANSLPLVTNRPSSILVEQVCSNFLIFLDRADNRQHRNIIDILYRCGCG